MSIKNFFYPPKQPSAIVGLMVIIGWICFIFLMTLILDNPKTEHYVDNSFFLSPAEFIAELVPPIKRSLFEV